MRTVTPDAWMQRFDESCAWDYTNSAFCLGTPSAAVNDAVKLVRFARVRSADKFVNAVLRRAVRESDYDPLTGISDPLERIAVGTSTSPVADRALVPQSRLSETEAFARRITNHLR